MSPAISVPMAFLFYLFFWVLVAGLFNAPAAVGSLYAGYAAGYILYDMTHYAMHYIKVPWRYFALIRNSHMRHHGQAPDMRFGVTNLVWDRVFGTLPEESKSPR